MSTLTGKVVLVTGSGRGIGRCVALRLARAGADVAIHDITLEAAREFGEGESALDAVAAVQALGRRSMVVTADLTDPIATQRAVETVSAELGGIDILVNVAGGDIAAAGGKPNPNDLFISDEDMHVVFARNLFTTMNACRAVVPSMKARGSGRIVNISSVNALFGVTTEIAYSSAKAGVLHYTRCLAASLREVGIQVNAICPGPIKTARFLATLDQRGRVQQRMEKNGALTRTGEPEDIAKAVEFFVSDLSDYITGQVLRVDGGMAGFPA